MSSRRSRIELAVVALVATASIGGVALDAWAQSSGGTFEVRRHAIAGGGGHAEGGVYVLDGTAAQADAGAVASGGAYALYPGFWHGVTPQAPQQDPVFKDGFE